MYRVVERELLDDLAPGLPEALDARRDLVRVNAWMGNARVAAREILRAVPKGSMLRIADLADPVSAELRHYLHGFLIYHFSKLAKGRDSALTP